VFYGVERWVAYSPGASALLDVFVVIVVKAGVVVLLLVSANAAVAVVDPALLWFWVSIHKGVGKPGGGVTRASESVAR